MFDYIVTDPEHLYEAYGEHSTWNTTALPLMNMKYRSGLPGFERWVADDPEGRKGWGLITTAYDWKGALLFSANSDKAIVDIPDALVDRVTLEAPPPPVTVTKSKSVVGRAVVGGLLLAPFGLAPIGALLGGASGIGKKEVQETPASRSDLALTFSCSDGEATGEVVFTVKAKNYKEVDAFLRNRYPGVYVPARAPESAPAVAPEGAPASVTTAPPVAAAPPPRPGTETKASPPAAPDFADQIRKLRELTDQGVLTEEEFNRKKTEILGRL